MYIYLFCHFINEDIAQNLIAAMEVLHLAPTTRIVTIILIMFSALQPWPLSCSFEQLF